METGDCAHRSCPSRKTKDVHVPRKRDMHFIER
jgi:hypothetical protein